MQSTFIKKFFRQLSAIFFAIFMFTPGAWAYFPEAGPNTLVNRPINGSMNGLNSSPEWWQQIQALQETIAQLQGHLEELSHRVDMLSNQTQQNHQLIEDKLAAQENTLSFMASEKAAEKAAAEKMAAEKAYSEKTYEKNHDNDHDKNQIKKSTNKITANATANDALEDKTYEKAYDLLLNKHYDQAIAALNATIKKYPKGKHTPQALYWLGEVYALKGQTALSKKAFHRLITQFPQHPKAKELKSSTKRSLK